MWRKLIGITLLCSGIGVACYYSFVIVKNTQEEQFTLEKAIEIYKSEEVKEVETVAASSVVIDGEPLDVVGVLTIPALQRELPIVEGVKDEDLRLGVGHYPGTKMPGENGQIVLSGHRDSVFRQLGELKKEDKLLLHTNQGAFTYHISRTSIVAADDTSIIDLYSTEEILVLSTCYPFRFVGNAPQRYIIYAVREEG